MLDDEFIYENVIPINFYTGTGGTFLCNFLQSAKYNSNQPYTFNKFGSLHANESDGHRFCEINLHAHPLITPLKDKLLTIKNSTIRPLKDIKNTSPYFTTIHGGDALILKQYFKKIINIHYNFAESYQIALIILLKVFREQETDNAKFTNKELQNTLKLTQNNSSVFCEKTDSNILSISWQEIFKKEPNILINKLYNFTNIPENNFFVDNLLKWRTKTRQCVFEEFDILI